MRYDTYIKDLQKYSQEMKHAIQKSSTRNSFPSMMLRAAGNDHNLRMKVLEFVDVLPSLDTSDEIYHRFMSMIGSNKKALPSVLRLGVFFFSRPYLRTISVHTLKWLIYHQLAPYFMVGNEEKILPLEKKYQKQSVTMNIDFLGELVTSECEAVYFFQEYLRAIRKYGKKEKVFNISIKFSALYPFFGPENYDESVKRVSALFADILRVARGYNVSVTVDAEHYAFCRLVEDIFCEVITQDEFKNTKHVGIALQAYRKDAERSAERFVEVAHLRETPFSVRLVKGAYWDTEIAIAKQKDWDFPLFSQKSETDSMFQTVFSLFLREWGHIYVSPATHNPESIAYVRYHAEEQGILSDENFTFQVLYGLGEPVRRALCMHGLPVMVYVPVGDLVKGMSYFTRRILENTSNEGFLFQLLE